MEEQNQEKATATQHVTVADAAAPETGNGKKEDKGGGKKEKKTAKPLTPKQLQQRKKLMVYPLMGLLFLGSMWLIFAPSEERDVNRDTVGAFNADIPLPENDGIIGDKRKAYEQALLRLTLTAPSSRRKRRISPAIFGTAYVEKHVPNCSSKPCMALRKPTQPSWYRSSGSTPRP